MLICNRCKKNEAYWKTWVDDSYAYLCNQCHDELKEMHEVLTQLEKEFMKNKTLKHIDLFWE